MLILFRALYFSDKFKLTTGFVVEFLKGVVIMKKIYPTAWFLLAILFFASVFTGSFNELSLVVFSLIALGLVYALALWAVIDHSRFYRTG